MAVKGFKPLEENFFNGRQSKNYTGLFGYKKEKLRVSIEADSYNFQCRAKIEIYEPENKAWNFLESIPYALMKSAGIHPYGDFTMVDKSKFRMDIDTLLNKAKIIL